MSEAMSAEIPFTKMQGLGNDFVVIDSLNRGESPFPVAKLETISSEMARQICDRRYGVGADQILWLKAPSQSVADARMEILNADGSIAEMCGNGIRAVGLYLMKVAGRKKTEFVVETLAGLQRINLHGEQVTVDMGKPVLGAGFPSAGEPIQIQDRKFLFYEVNVGNPHAVFFVDNVNDFPVEEIGPLVETHRRFPNRTNVEFVEIRSPSSIKVRVWERGAGVTLACGTGACAAAVASIALRKTDPSAAAVDVELPGGKLKLSWKGGAASVFMEGPAQEVFRGSYFLKKKKK